MMNKKRLVTRATLALFFIVTALAIAPRQATATGKHWDGVPRTTHVPILMYHYIDTPPADADRYLLDLTVTRKNFEQQVKWLKDQGYQSVTPDDLISALWEGKALPKKPVMLTFDDGYANAWYNAFPVLRKAGFSGTFFVVTDWLDQNRRGYLNWPLARIMSHYGMYIENHSRTHEDFRNRSHEWYLNEIVGPMKDIEQHTGVKPVFFCFPFGGYDDVAIHELEAAGVLAAFTENDSRYEYASNTMHMPRVRIRGSMTLEEFGQAVTDSR
jgi:peptidoglycan/xylan/chitin deacetylase (PgdA/CDA1 family)